MNAGAFTLPTLLEIFGQVATMDKVALSESLVAYLSSTDQNVNRVARNAQKLSGFGHGNDRFFLEHGKSFKRDFA
jgi:hypothetical protein